VHQVANSFSSCTHNVHIRMISVSSPFLCFISVLVQFKGTWISSILLQKWTYPHSQK
jgi:hypothetical protein